MKLFKHLYILTFLIVFSSITSQAQQRKIKIEYSGFLTFDEANYPGAKVLTRDDSGQVHIIHDGVNMWCDQAIHYSSENFIEAYGNVNLKQGDTINMDAKYIEYSGKTQLAFASGDVVLTEPSSILSTDTLYFDRVKQQAFYNHGGTVVRDSSGTITSKIGRYYMEINKYQFLDSVKLVNPEYVLETERLDYFTQNGHAYLFGPSTITGETNKIYCERGFYDTEFDTGYFIKNSRIDYDNRIFEGDSMYFDRNRSFASATNNIKVTDTINQSVIKGHYAEIFKEKDSVFITKRALAITVQERDSIYMHADTLMLTGDAEHRITRAFRNAKTYKSDMSSKADSIHVDHEKGLTQLINISQGASDAFSKKRQPILWNIENQMTGDTIHLISNPETEKLDTLLVFKSAFLIGKDTLSDNGYNQISGQKLIGLFDEQNKLKQINIIKNAQSITYARDDKQELIGIDKAKSGSISILIENSELIQYIRYNIIDANTYPESLLPENEKRLKGFDWREEERPKSVEDLFSDDLPLNLPKIKGLNDYVEPEDFFDDAMLERIEKADEEEVKKDKTSEKTKRASRNLPKKIRQDSIVGNPNIKKKLPSK